MTSRFAALEDLIHEAEAKAAAEPDPVAALVTLLRRIIVSEADPYLLAGSLIEGIVSIIIQRIPPEKQAQVAIDVVRLLRDRFSHSGIV